MPDSTYDLSPSKQTYRSLRSDVTPLSSVKELVDNVLDNWRRVDQENPGLTIDIDFDFENGRFRIEDNSGGMADDDISAIFSLGASSKTEIPWSIGSYGMGAKKAIVRLGNQATIKSRTNEADTGYGFSVGEEWLEQDSWEVEREEFPDLDPGTTVIEVNGLDIEIGNESEEETSEYESPEEFLSALRTDLEETYEEFLSGRVGPDDGDLSMVVNGDSLDEPNQPDWSYTPYDGYHPRYFQRYQINADELPMRDSPVFVDVIAGLLRKGEEEEAGTDIIIQNRKIISNSKDETGGWGSYLSNFGPQVRRTKFIVKISTQDHPEDLPWDTQKSHIDTNNVIADKVFNFLRRAGRAYANAEYGSFPASFTSPYSSDFDASRDDLMEELDYSSRTQVRHRPDEGFTQASEVQSIVEKHKEWNIFAAHLLSNSHRPSYRSEYDPERNGDRDYEPDSEEVWIVPEDEQDLSELELHTAIELIRGYAESHADNSEKIDFDGDNPWWREYYEYVLSNQVDDLADLDSTVEPPNIEEEIEERSELGELTEQTLISTPTTAEAPSPDEDCEEETDSGDEESDDSESDSTSDDEEEDETEEDDSGTEGDEESDEDTDEETDEDDGEGLDLGDDLGGTEGLVRIADGENVYPIVIPLSEESYQAICEEVGLSVSEATPSELGREIIEQNLDIYEFITDSTRGDAE